MSLPTSKHRLCLLAFSETSRDARVLRQARALAKEFRVTLAGYGENPFANEPELGIQWNEINRIGWCPKGLRFWERLYLQLGRFIPGFVERYLTLSPQGRHAWHLAHSNLFRVIYCNDVDMLPIGIAAWRNYGRYAKIILDLHEYATREMEDDPEWRRTRKPFVTSALRHFSKHAHATVTVVDSFVPLFRKEFGMKKPVVIYNAPDIVPLPRRNSSDGKIHLIHHGRCSRHRQMELMIRMMAHTDERFVLHMMLEGGEADYRQQLRDEAAALPADKVFFEEPVPPSQIVQAISRHDIGVYILPPVTFNDEHALPNKFFDFIGAGLGIAIAPSPNMASLVKEHGIGWIADDFKPQTMARMLNALREDEIAASRSASLKLRETLNAQTEMAKLVELVKKTAGNTPVL